MSSWSLTFQVVNFLVLAAILRRFLFKPVTEMIARRQEQLERARSEAERLRQEAVALRGEAERATADIAADRNRVLEEARKQIDQERGETLATTRHQTEALLEEARREIEREREIAAEKVSSEALDLGAAIARRLLEQVPTTGVAEVFLGRLCEHLGELAPDRRDSLRAELSGGELLVATTPALATDVEARWLTSITGKLGDGVRARFVRDDALVAGAELRFPHTTLSLSWRDGLRAAREELLHDAEHH